MNLDSSDRSLMKLLEPLTLRPKEIDESFKKGSSKSSSNYEKGLRARARGDFISAIGLYRQSLHEDPYNFGARINIGVCYIKLGLLKEAISNFQKAETIHAKDNIARFNLVLCHIHLHDYSQAQTILQRAVQSENSREELYKLWALVLLRMGDVHGARKLLNNNKYEEGKSEENLRLTIDPDNLEIREPIIHSKNSSVSMKTRPKSNRNTQAFMDFLGHGNSFSCKSSQNRDTRKFSLYGEGDKAQNDKTPKVNIVERQMRITSANPKLSIRKKKSFITGERPKQAPIISINIEPKRRVSTRPRSPLKRDSSSEILHSIMKRSIDYDLKIQVRESQLKEMVPLSIKSTIKPENILKDGLVQEELEESCKIDDKLTKTFDNKFKHFKDLVNKEEYTHAYIRPSLKELDTLEKIKRNSLRVKSMKFLISEYMKDPEERNYVEMSNIVQKLPFFSKFPGGIRIMVLKIADFKYYAKGETVIVEGEYGDSMFVILQGSIVVEKRQPGSTIGMVVVQTLYDGDQFGELALLSGHDSSTQRRNATCIAGEDSYLLSISKQDYHNVLLKLMRNDIEGKIKFLQSLRLFVDVDSKNLIPLASNLSPRIYRVNDVILAQGQIPEGLYIIYKGHCRVYKEGQCIRPAGASEYANPKIRKPPPRNFIIGNYTPTDQSKEVSHKRVKSARVTAPHSRRSSVMSKSYREPEETFYTTHEKILFSNLKEGDYFGGRKMLEGDYPPIEGRLYSDDENNTHLRTIVVEPSKFTIIAETVEVEMFILTKKHYSLLTDDMIVRYR
jgi:CRP-like cAMP-binding protein/tetratricopeptide (TPR) repeat protein